MYSVDQHGKKKNRSWLRFLCHFGWFAWKGHLWSRYPCIWCRCSYRCQHTSGAWSPRTMLCCQFSGQENTHFPRVLHKITLQSSSGQATISLFSHMSLHRERRLAARLDRKNAGQGQAACRFQPINYGCQDHFEGVQEIAAKSSVQTRRR